MKKYLVSGAVVFGLLAASAASAADLPRRTGEPMPPVFIPPAFTWTGFYVGANAGYSFGDAKADTIGTPAFQSLGANIVPPSLNTKKDGFTGGVQVGYNYQMGSIVLGAEADINFLDAKKTATFSGAAIPGLAPFGLTTSATNEVNYLGTLRARIGFLPTDRLLIFATGGLAMGDVESSGFVVVNGAPGVNWAGSKSEFRVGYALGGGAEYAITNNLTFKVEGLYYDLGKQTVNATGNAAVRSVAALNGIDYASSARTSGTLVRAGVNYKF